MTNNSELKFTSQGENDHFAGVSEMIKIDLPKEGNNLSPPFSVVDNSSTALSISY